VADGRDAAGDLLGDLGDGQGVVGFLKGGDHSIVA
jgi:hypothetical protein